MSLWTSSISISPSDCTGCCSSGCVGCTGQTTSPDYYNVTLTITNPGIWDVGGSDWGCGGVMGSELTWDGIMPNDGNCVLDLQPYCPFPLSSPPYVFDYSWFNGKTFRVYTRGVGFDYLGCQYVGVLQCTQSFGSYVFTTSLTMTIYIPSPGSITYDLTIGGTYNDPAIPVTIARSVTGASLSWGCSGSSFTSATGTFNMNSPGPGIMPYGSFGAGGTVAGSFVVTP